MLFRFTLINAQFHNLNIYVLSRIFLYTCTTLHLSINLWRIFSHFLIWWFWKNIIFWMCIQLLISWQLRILNPNYITRLWATTRNCQTVFHSGATVLDSHQQWEHSCCCSSLPAIIFLEISLSNRCVVISPNFSLYFLQEKLCWAYFNMLICHLYILWNYLISF